MNVLHKTRLGDMLVLAGALTEGQLEWALDKQRESYKRLGEILTEYDLASDDDITEARALQLDMPHVQLENSAAPGPGRHGAGKHCGHTSIGTGSASGEKLAVAMSNPMDVEAIDAAGRYAKKRIEPAAGERIFASSWP